MLDFFRRRTELAQSFAQAVRRQDPSITATVRTPATVELEGPDGHLSTCSLDSLSREWKVSKNKHELVEHYAASMLRSIRPLSDRVEREHVLPMLKPRGWAEQACAKQEDRPITFSISRGLELVFVEERASQLRFVAQPHLDVREISTTTLHDLAMANLGALAVETKLERANGSLTWIASLPGRYAFNASLALLPAVWEQAERVIGGQAICAIPERELCIFCGRYDEAALSELEEEFRADLFRASGYPVSINLFEMRCGQLSEVAL